MQNDKLDDESSLSSGENGTADGIADEGDSASTSEEGSAESVSNTSNNSSITIDDADASESESSFGNDEPEGADDADITGADESDADDYADSGDLGGNASADSSMSSEASTSSDKEEEKKMLKRSVKTADDKRYTVRVAYDDRSGIPENAELRVVRVMETPEGYDSENREWRGRPTEEERFVSAKEMSERKAELDKVLDVQEDDYVWYSEFLDISIVADGVVVKPASRIEVTIETDAVKEAASDAVMMSFYTKKRERQKHADALKLDNHSGDIFKDDAEGADRSKTKEYEEGAKLSFETSELSELGIAGIAVPLTTEQIEDTDVEVLGPTDAGVEIFDPWVDESLLPEDARLMGSLGFSIDPQRDYGTMLWIRPASADAGESAASVDDEEAEGAAETKIEKATSGADEKASADAEDVELSNELATSDANAVNGDSSQKRIVGYLIEDDSLGDKLFDSEDAQHLVAFDSDDKIAFVELPVSSSDKNEIADSSADNMVADGESKSTSDASAGYAVADSPAIDSGESPKKTVIKSGIKLQPVVSDTAKALSCAKGGAYSVKVTYGSEAGIPEDASVQVRELSGSEYAFASRSALHALKSSEAEYLRAFDITILNAQGNEVQPQAPVDVSVSLADASELEDLSVVHLGTAGPEVVDAEGAAKDNTYNLGFTANSFSVYVVAGGVDGSTLTAAADGQYLAKRQAGLEGSWATWEVVVNPDGDLLNEGQSLTLKDTFNFEDDATTAEQSIDYSSITVTSDESVTYDYRGSTGTFTIPDSTAVTVTYRARITAQPGETVTYGGTAQLLRSDDDVIETVEAKETAVVYPSASEVSGGTGEYMVKIYTYAEGQMQVGLADAEFVLLDENKRPMTYKDGDNAGDPVTFTTVDGGYANVQLDEESCGVSIQKNTAYYLEMIKAPEGYRKDNTLYSFMITDNPGYESGDVWTYYNGDTMKVRLYPEEACLSVSMRFSGNYALTQDQQDNIKVILQKKTGEDAWEEVESHYYSDFSYGTLTFDKGKAGDLLELGATYRVVEEGERPWELSSSVILNTTYYLIVGSEESQFGEDPLEFTITEDIQNSSFNAVIDNEYEEPKLTLVKMDKETGKTLSGAVFTVKKVRGDAEVKSYTTDDTGEVVISGGSDFESETLYYIEETAAPTGYLLPLQSEKAYFYFCNDEYLIPEILADLPEGETAVNLSEDYESLTINNEKQERTIPVMATWQGNAWPDEIASVKIGLYQSVDGATPEPVADEAGDPLTVVLSKIAPYNNSAFQDLPARDGDDYPITYSIVEENVLTQDEVDVKANYVQEYGVSDSGVYIVRNKLAASLAVDKEWYSADGQKVEDDRTLQQQPDVVFDVYRSTEKISDEIRADGITCDEMTNFISGLKKVRTDLTFGYADNWATLVDSLDKFDDFGNPYYYYTLEAVPSFGDETYEVDEDNGTATIKNKVTPQTSQLTVEKAALVNDPRPEAKDTEFEFTLALAKGERAIRGYEIAVKDADSLTTNVQGEVTFKLKPEQKIELSLPVGVTATITETPNPEYIEEASSSETDLEDENSNVFSYTVTESSVTVTYTNTLHVICKVVDPDGAQHPYESLKSALAYIRNNEQTFGGSATIEMLEDYDMPATDVFDIAEDEVITLTTAATDDAEFPFRTERTGDHSDRAIITRAGQGDSLIGNEGELTLSKVCVDGDKDQFTAEGNGGLVNNTGTLNLANDVSLCNSSAEVMGGAVYSTGTVNMSGGEIIGNTALNGSAIYLGGGTMRMTGGEITLNSDADDGAVVVVDSDTRVYLSGSSKIYENTNGDVEAADLYIGADSDNIVNVVDPGLSADALIGVTALAGHREIGEQFAFAEYGMTNNLDRFFNDEYDYRGKLKDGTSTNVVWDGLTLQINKVVADLGANPDDAFTIRLSSRAIKKSSYIINGTVDYTITPAKLMTPGVIELRNVKTSDSISISPLPAGSYVIEEESSNYDPTYTGVDEYGKQITIGEGGAFALSGNSTVTVTNTRKLADVDLQKSLVDRLMGDEAASFDFTIKLTEADGDPIAGFSLAEGVTTNGSGEATVTLKPTNTADDSHSFVAPVGATMAISENESIAKNYNVTISAITKPAEDEGTSIEDEDDEKASFTFVVGDDGAAIKFDNERKMAPIELSKEIVNKVSAPEPISFTVTLEHQNGNPAKNYVMYEDSEKTIATNEEGKATITFDFLKNTTSESVVLTIPEGLKLQVEETEVKKSVGSSQASIYDTTYSINGGADKTGLKAVINSVSDNDQSIAFTNTRKTRTVKVTNTVSGYSGNTAYFTYTATVTDGEDGRDDDYDSNGFTDGVQTFQLATGQSQTLVVPYGATLNVTETYAIGYETKVKHGNGSAITATYDEFEVTDNVTVAFTNTQLISLRLVNNTTSDLTGVQVYVSYGTRMYRVNDAQDGQDEVTVVNHWATVKTIAAGKTAILEVNHENSVTAEQAYTVKGSTPKAGYYYTINNEPSYHEFADPAVMRVYNVGSYEVKGKLRYSTSDSTVTFTEQPLVSFDVNGGVWTTEMEGYNDRDGDRQVYQMAVTTGETVSQPTNPIYPTAEGIEFLGWTMDEDFAKASHAVGEDVSAKLYNFDSAVTEPISLYAIWTRQQRDTYVVTASNEITENLTVTATLTQDGSPVKGSQLADGVTTGSDGKASFSLTAGEAKNLMVSNGVKLVLQTSGAMAYSSVYTDADSTSSSFTIDSVERDGTVSFIGGICKITDGSGNLLYDSNGRPAVYTTLAAAFSAYTGMFYLDKNRSNSATPEAVKMLVDEYAIAANHDFPNGNMLLTTAGKDDVDFPYVGMRTRSTLYRADSFLNCFFLINNRNKEYTLSDIVLDGKDIPLTAGLWGSFIYLNDSSVLNIQSGTTMRNAARGNYSENSCGGAICAWGSTTVNVTGGLFEDLHARRGGAINVHGSATLSITGTSASPVKFKDCSTDADSDNSNGADGGAIYSGSSKNLTINGGADKDNPGIVFDSCVAGSSWGDGGAIYATSNITVTVSGCYFNECSARNTSGGDTNGFGGGAIAAKSVKKVAVSQSKFIACDSMRGGGALMAYVKTTTDKTNDEVVSITDCVLDRCNCMSQGGAVSAYQDSNSNTSSTSKLSVVNSTFSNCSSGTKNGSGGAIQCYLPRMAFTGTSFTDCWAGKEGGAINNWYGANDAQMWENASVSVENCRFVRCRAEDRYDLTGKVHFGGGIATKAKVLTVKGSYFEECVSTLKQGGAVHCSGIGTGSSATVENSEFKDCMAKDNGGAFMASSETMTVSGSKFENCSSFANSGGAIYHGDSVNTATQSGTTITGCTFTSDSAASNGGAIWSKAGTVTVETSGMTSCTAVGNGGAVWTSGSTVNVRGCTIGTCSADGNGGGIYQSGNGNSATLSTTTGEGGATLGSITNCQANNGSAVYAEGSATFSGVSITGNAVSQKNSGAIHGGKLYFEGSVEVQGNTCSSDEEYKHDVLLQNDNATTINTTSTGLADGAKIGVYVTDERFANRGQEGDAFGTHGTDGGKGYLDSFFNDRDDLLYGYMNTSTDTNIYWGTYICKITDADGNTLTRSSGGDAVYQRLSLAFADFTSVTGGTPKYVKMLVENYSIQQSTAINNFPNADITLTTASKSEVDNKHPYRGTEGTFCTISRSISGDADMFYMNNSNATFQLENITLDGRFNQETSIGNLRLIGVQNGSVIINRGTTMQYGNTTYTPGNQRGGGAIYANGTLTVNGEYDAESGAASVRFINCTSSKNTSSGAIGDWNGGAIDANTLVINCANGNSDAGQYGTAFIDCAAARGGAIHVVGAQATVNGAEFQGCYCKYEGGAFYHNNDGGSNASTIADSAFTDCHTSTDNHWSYGGAINSKAGYLTVTACDFTRCEALSNGGAINHGSEKPNRANTTITSSTFTECKTTGSNGSYSYGGSVYTQAREVQVDRCSFDGSTATNNGGALYCENNAGNTETRILGSSFTNCMTSKSGGYGGAVFARGNTVTIQDAEDATASSFEKCVALGYSGAIYMDRENSALSIGGKTLVKGCYANQGGALYLKNKVTLNLTESPEFKENGYTTLNGSVVNAQKGACIYLVEGSKANLSGAPKFSRNNLTNQERVTNGGVTDYVRQDLYLAGYSGKTAVSIHVMGELTGDTIWVWPENSPHRGHGEQFATTETSVSAKSLDKFRNALADGVTGCSNGEYLAGVRRSDKDQTHVYWDKMYSVSFNKIDNKAVAVAGAEFTLYSDSQCAVKVADATSADGETDTNAQGELLDKGKVDFDSIPIGVYYMKETVVPTSYKGNSTVYLVLVGSPALSPQNNRELWESGPLNVDKAETLVARCTVNAGMYYGVFPIGDDGKADVSKNLAAATVGIINTRNDYVAYFMKVDASGVALPNAEFTLYAAKLDNNGVPEVYENNYPKLELWSRDGENYPDPVKSADGTTKFKDSDGNVLSKGLAYFRELPIGTYYLLETACPYRNGNNRRTFYVETDRVFRLEVKGDDGFVLSQWQEDGTYAEVQKQAFQGVDYYTVGNTEAVCKLTDGSGSLLYELGHDGVTRYPALYSTLEEGFAAAQEHVLQDKNGDDVASSELSPSLKLQVLKDLSFSSSVSYTSPRALTLTTASRTSKESDPYVFVTNRTSYTSRAELKRAYSESDASNSNAGALVTVGDGASLTLQNVSLNGQKTQYNGRAVHVTSGSLTIYENTLIQNFKQAAAASSSDGNDIKGGAILLDDGTALTVNGGSASRSALFSSNEVENARTSGDKYGADGGAIAVGKECTVSLTNAQLIGNKASSAMQEAGNGGAISMNKTKDAETQAELPLSNVVFRRNQASYNGGAIRTSENCYLTVEGCEFKDNKAGVSGAGDGGAIAALSGEGAVSSLTVTGGTFMGNSATGGNGGAIKIGGSGVLSLGDGVKIKGNSAGSKGGAVFAAEGAHVVMTGGSITGNAASDDSGGAVNLGTGAKIQFSGAPVVHDNPNGNSGTQQKNVVLSENSNGTINTTGDGLTGGKIGVYVVSSYFEGHGGFGEPFGTMDAPDKQKTTLSRFINDVNGLAGIVGDQEGLIYWNELFCVSKEWNSGLDASKYEIEYTLYRVTSSDSSDVTIQYGTQEEATSLLSSLAENGYSASEYGSYRMNASDSSGWTREFSSLPAGTYYVVETAVNDISDSSNPQDVTDQLVVTYEYNPDNRTVVIKNAPSASCKVILSKVDSVDRSQLEGFQFRIFNGSLSEVGDGYTSLSAGVFFVGELTTGDYYVVETAAPTPSTGEPDYRDNAGKVFKVVVSADGAGSPEEKGQIDVSSADSVRDNLRALLQS